jgi:hypothetical protein
MNNVQQLLESSNTYTTQLQEAARLSSKWEKFGLLEGLSGYEKGSVSMMLENQAKRLLAEASSTNSGGASFSAGAGEQWPGIALPLVRRVFAEISAKEFLSVQPMNLPAGLVFYLDFKYGNTKGLFTSGKSLYGSVSDEHPTPTTVPPTGGGYGMRFGYSLNNASSSVSTGAATTASWADVNFDDAVSASVAAGQIKKVTVTSASLAGISLDANASRGFLPTSGSAGASGTIDASTVLPAYSDYITGNNTFVFYVTSSAHITAASAAVTLYYTKQTKDNARGDFEDNPNNSITIPEFNISMKSEFIVAETRKLKAQWTPEFAQDFNAYHALDAEAELTSLLSQHVAMEIDMELINMLIENALVKEYWSANNNQFINADASAFTNKDATTGGYYNSQGQWFQTLGTKLQKASNKIAQLTLKGGANWILVSPTIATVLESIPGFATDGDGEKGEFNFGVQKIGSLSNRYKVYKNPYMTENVILMGYKGGQFLETGAVYAPYIPLMMTPLLYDPNTFTPRKGLMTRYGKKMLRPEFYGKIIVTGLNSL